MLKKSKKIVGSNVIKLQTVDSTNIYVKEHVKDANFIDGTVVYTLEQSSGKGQGTNKWESEPNKNLTMSILLQPLFLAPENQFEISKAIALGVADFIKSMIDEQVFIKWPNDIYVNEYKIAGILIENIIQGSIFNYCIVGIGLNVNQTIFLSDAPNPISLKNITKKNYDVEKILLKLCKFINKRYICLEKNNSKELTKDYFSYLFRYQMFNKYLINEVEIEAKITNVDKYGRLILVDKNNNTHTVDLKEIKYLNISKK